MESKDAILANPESLSHSILTEEDKLGMLSNKVISNPEISEQELPVLWRFSLLKYNEYDSKRHESMQTAERAHFHSFFELHIPIQGILEYQIGGEVLCIRAGEYLMIPPHIVHDPIAYSSIVKKYSFAFQIESQDERLDLLKLLGNRSYYKGEQTKELLTPLKYVLDCINESDRNAPFTRYLIRAQFNSFYLALLNEIRRNVQGENDSVPTNDNLEINDQMIYDFVVQYLNAHMSRHVTVSEIAHELLISGRQMNRRLIRFKGIPFSKIQEQIKCSHARELLASNLSLSEISERIGMGNEYAFNRFFKRVEGMPPARFRNALRRSNYK